jgi:hypothetical protein
MNNLLGSWTRLTLALSVTAAASVVALPGPDPAAPLPPIGRGPYLQQATADSICIVWRTDWERIDPVVRFGSAPDKLDRLVSGRAVTIKAALGKSDDPDPRVQALRTSKHSRLARLHSAPAGTFQYEARLSGLSPRTRYYYAVCDGAKRLTPPDESYQFTTYPRIGENQPVRFWVTGDTGTARAPQYRCLYSALQLAEREKRPFDFFLHTGDIAYMSGTEVQFQTRFFKPYERSLRHLVFWPTMSNHDGATAKSATGEGPYFDAFVVPTRGEAGGVGSGLEAIYSFQWGRVHFVCLDSFHLSRKTDAVMAAWLRKDLAKAKADRKTDWLIAFFHHPAYTKGSHDGTKEKEPLEMRQWIQPILDAGGVDVVFNGHSHTYERTMLMDGCYGTNQVSENFVLDDGDGSPYGDGPYRKSAGIHPREGHVTCVTGHGGMSLGRVGTLPFAVCTFSEYGSTVVDIDGDTLTATMINQYGDKLDCFQIIKRGKVTPVRQPVPWQPAAWPPPAAAKPQFRNAMEAPPVQHRVLIPPGAPWQYLAGSHPKTTDWRWPAFDAQGWATGRAAFGYKYTNNVQTSLDAMRGHYGVVYLRKEFVVDRPDRVTELGLMIDYDDAFIAYLNGREVVRKGVERSSGLRAQKLTAHDSAGYTYHALANFSRWLVRGTNVLALEGYNHTLDSSDFLLDPYLISEE